MIRPLNCVFTYIFPPIQNPVSEAASDPVTEDGSDSADDPDSADDSDSADVHGTGNEDVVGVEEPYEVWCSALRALDLVNANNIPAVGRELSESGYLPNSLDLKNLGELGMVDDFFNGLKCLESVKPLKDWIIIRGFLKQMMMATPKGQMCPDSFHAVEDPTVPKEV